MRYQVLPLHAVPHLCPIAAYWAYYEWYSDKNIDFSALIKVYQQRAGKSSLPLSWLVLRNKLPVGMISLKEKELRCREEFSPWISALYVVPSHRRKGVAAMLMNAVYCFCQNQGFSRIFLFADYRNLTCLEKYYQAQGWLFLEQNLDNEGHRVSLYCRTL
jgi:GNAT superfamily N-acetyltransferase